MHTIRVIASYLDAYYIRCGFQTYPLSESHEDLNTETQRSKTKEGREIRKKNKERRKALKPPNRLPLLPLIVYSRLYWFLSKTSLGFSLTLSSTLFNPSINCFSSITIVSSSCFTQIRFFFFFFPARIVNC